MDPAPVPVRVLTLLDGFTFELPIRVRFRDTDMMGHVNNAVYVTYFEAGRVEWWIAVTGDPDALEKLPFILARTEIDFLAEVRAAEDLTLGVRAGKLGNKSFELEYLLVRDRDGAEVARGKSVQVMYDYQSKKTVLLEDATRAMIAAFEGAAAAG